MPSLHLGLSRSKSWWRIAKRRWLYLGWPPIRKEGVRARQFRCLIAGGSNGCLSQCLCCLHHSFPSKPNHQHFAACCAIIFCDFAVIYAVAGRWRLRSVTVRLQCPRRGIGHRPVSLRSRQCRQAASQFELDLRVVPSRCYRLRPLFLPNVHSMPSSR